MLLSDEDIKKHLQKGTIEITPPVDDKNIRPVGIRLHLLKI